jgi:hypothetical protein
MPLTAMFTVSATPPSATVLPYFRDLVARLRHDLDRADAHCADHHR